MTEVTAMWLVLHDKETAVELGRGLLQERLVAGYNLLSVESAFWWNDSILEGPETLLLLKTRVEHTDAINARVASLTGADVPDGFAVSHLAMSAPFERWVLRHTEPSATPH